MGHDVGRLGFRHTLRGPSLDAGDWSMEPVGGRGGVIYVPDTAERGAPVMVFLHGAGGTGRRELRAVMGSADRFGAVIVAPDARGPTWDVIGGGFGPDVAFIDAALTDAADRLDVDFGRLAIGGISDGASYALSLGLTNGDLFTAVVAFSPGFLMPGPLTGRPPIFVSHGTADPILPIDACSRRIVPALSQAGYDVTFREFDGGHTVPAPIADEGVGWWVRQGPSRGAG